MNNSNQRDATSVPLALWCLGLGLLGALSIWFYQIFTFLRSGDWAPISVVTALGWLKIEWALFPTQWLGAHKILDFLPLSLFSLGFAVISGLVLNHSGEE
jgi:hypothetical protein